MRSWYRRTYNSTDANFAESAVATSFTAGDLVDVAADDNIANGVGSSLTVSALYGSGAEQADQAFQAQQDALYGPGQTIGNLSARNSLGLMADSVLLGDTIYINLRIQVVQHDVDVAVRAQ